MARSHVVTGLERRYALLLGLQAKGATDAIVTDLSHIAAVIRMFEPHWSPDTVKPIEPRAPIRWRRKGDGFQYALQVLREADRPLSATEIATLAIARSGITPPPQQRLRTIGTDMSYGLRKLLGDDLVVIEGRPKRYSYRK
ncbi:MAG: hypothetical protein HC788_08120 [Sphingopyxis sp.]|nr:hypothetical protein [Sphingopyxis sp.]